MGSEMCIRDSTLVNRRDPDMVVGKKAHTRPGCGDSLLFWVYVTSREEVTHGENGGPASESGLLRALRQDAGPFYVHAMS